MAGFTKAVKDYFGTNGQKLSDFAAEIKALPDADRAELAQMLADELGEAVTVKIAGTDESFAPAAAAA